MEKRKHLLGIYEKALYTKSLDQMLNDAAELGYDNFELSIDEKDWRLERLEWTAEDIRKLYRQSRDAGVSIWSMCFSGQRRYPMGSADPEIRRYSLSLMNKAIRFAAELGVRVIQVAGYDVWYEPHTDDTAAWFKENLYKSACLAERRGVMLSVETVEAHITSVREAANLIGEIGSPWLTIYHDIANMSMLGFDPVKELREARKLMTAIHVQDVPDIDYTPFGEGDMDFDSVFGVLEDIDFHGPVTVELWNEDNREYKDVLASAVTFLSNYL